MSFTPIAIEGQFINADGSYASGTVCVTPNSTLLNAGESQSAQPICGVLDGLGRITSQGGEALIVNATDDAGTSPIGSSCTFLINLDGQSAYQFESPVPSGANSALPAVVTDSVSLTATSNQIVLNELIASTTMIGKTLTGAGITGTATITAINQLTNTLTINVNATTTETSTITIAGAAVSINTLKANSL